MPTRGEPERRRPSDPMPHNTSPEKTAMYRVAYEEGKRTVDDQVAELDSMRQRSVQFLAFVGSATAFLVGSGLSAPTRGPLFLALALLASLLSIASILLVLCVLLTVVFRRGRPQRIAWNLRISARVLVEHWVGPEVGAASESKYLRDLALQYDGMAMENDPNMRVVRRRYGWFLFIGSLQVLVWASLVWAYN